MWFRATHIIAVEVHELHLSCHLIQLRSWSNYKSISLSLANHHQRWMYYELAAGSLLHTPLECGLDIKLPQLVLVTVSQHGSSN